MYCSKCGTYIRYNARFCPSCGKSVLEEKNGKADLVFSKKYDLNLYDTTLKANRNFLLYIFLSIITCGIYALFFWNSYTKDLNKVCNDGQNAPNSLIVFILSILTCGIYYLCWIYKNANRIKEAGNRFNVMVHENGTNMILWSTIGAILTVGIGFFIAQYFMISNLNKVIKKIKY